MPSTLRETSENELPHPKQNRYDAAVKYFGSKHAEALLLEDRYYCRSFETGIERGPFKKIYVLLTGARTCEGDFGLTLLIQPQSPEHGLLRVAQVSFNLTDGCITVTGLQGASSSFNRHAASRFGREFLDKNNFYEQMKQALNGIKPFNLLIGLLIEICSAKGIDKIRGNEKNVVHGSNCTHIKHNFAGTYCSCGLRPTSTEGVFEAILRSPQDIKKCFARITGKDPKIKSSRQKFLNKTRETLESACPFLFEPLTDKTRSNTRSAVKKCLSET